MSEFTPIQFEFSASRLKLIDDCFGKYAYKYVHKLNIPQLVWPATIRGTILHKILEESVNQKLQGTPDKIILEDVEGKFVKYFDIEKKNTSKGIFTPDRNYRYDDFVQSGEKAAYIFSRFVINYFNDITFAFPELSLKFTYDFEPNVLLTGVIDLPILDKHNELRIIDFKTTKHSNKWYFVLFKEDLQSLMYFYLTWKHFHKFAVGFDYLIYNIDEKNIFFNSFSILNSIDDKEKFFKPLTDRIRLVKRLHMNPDTKYFNPSQSRCKMCEYKKNKICPVAI